MTRLPSHIFENPGFHSLTVPYHDTNDFYYSGHVGTCFLLFLEFHASGWPRMSYYCLFTLVNQWVMMTFTGNHYVIDLISGMIIAHYVHMFSERLSFLPDQLGMRIPGFKRQAMYFEPCEKCGWSNYKAINYMPSSEKRRIQILKDEVNYIN